MEMEKGLPTKIFIGGHEYEVSQDRDGYLMGAECLGEIRFHDLVLMVRSDITESRKLEAFCHEVVHGLRYDAGFLPAQITNEAEVRPMGSTLYRLLRDNDFSFMYQGAKEKPLEIHKLECGHLEEKPCDDTSDDCPNCRESTRLMERAALALADLERGDLEGAACLLRYLSSSAACT